MLENTKKAAHKRKKILILGATGMLGHQFWRVFNCHQFIQNNFEVYGSIRKKKQSFENFKINNLFDSDFIIDLVNLENFLELKLVLDNLRPDIIINCAGLTLRKHELNNIEKCYKINGFLPSFLAAWANQNEAKVIHFSTDCVFDGKTSNSYVECDMPTAFDNYGISKYLGEIKGNPHLTLRLSIVGREIINKSELIEWFISQKNKEINGFSSVFYSGVTTRFLVNEIIRLLQNEIEVTGIYHLSSKRESKYNILNMINEKMKLNIKIRKDVTQISDKSLNSEKYIQKTGFKVPSWDEMIEDLILDNEFYEDIENVFR